MSLSPFGGFATVIFAHGPTGAVVMIVGSTSMVADGERLGYQ